MPPKSYVYVQNNSTLINKIPGACEVVPLGINKTTQGDLQIVMPAPLDEVQKANLDDYMATRGLVQSAKAFLIHANSKLVNLPIDLGVAWTDLGGVVTNPNFFIPNIAACIGLIAGSIKTSGEGAKLRVVEIVDEVEAVIAEVQLPNTNNEWQMFQFTTETPSSTPVEKTYILRGDANGLDAKARFMTVGLVEILQT